MISVSLKINEIKGFHKDVRELIAQTSSIIFQLAPHECSKLLLENLLILHPLHVLKTDEGYQLIAGFRTYEMAMLVLDEDQPIDCLVHESSSFGKMHIINLALSDIVGTSVLLTKISKPNHLIKRLNSVVGSVKIKQLFKDISGKSKIDTRHNLEPREKNLK